MVVLILVVLHSLSSLFGNRHTRRRHFQDGQSELLVDVCYAISRNVSVYQVTIGTLYFQASAYSVYTYCVIFKSLYFPHGLLVVAKQITTIQL